MPADLSGREPPLGLEGLLVAIREEMIKGWRDSTTPTTFGVVSSLIEALVNSCVPVQDPADRAWDAATGVVERAPVADVCTWPGCKAPPFCSSGNFGNQLVCVKHLAIVGGTISPSVSGRAPVAETLCEGCQQYGRVFACPECAILNRPSSPGRARETAPAPDWHPFDTAPKDRWVWMCNLDRQRISAFKWDSSHKAWFAGTGWWPSISKFFTHWSEMSEQPPSVPAAAPPAQEPSK